MERILAGLTGLWFLFECGRMMPGSEPASPGALSLLEIALGAAAVTVLALRRELPWQNIFMATGLAALVGAASWGTAFFLLPRTITSGWKDAPPSCWIGASLLWVSMVFNARGAIRILLDALPPLPARGWWSVGLTGALTGLMALVSREFLDASTQFTISMGLSGMVAAAAMLTCVAVFPFLLNKHPGPAAPPSRTPLFLLICLGLGGGGLGFIQRDPTTAVAGALLCLFMLAICALDRKRRDPSANLGRHPTPPA